MVRFKNRYIVVEITPGDMSDKSIVLKSTTLHYAILQKVQQFYGDFGAAAFKAGYNAKYCNARTRIALIKVRHGPHRFLLNSLSSITDIGGKLVSVSIVYVGATMKHCFHFIKNYQRKKLEAMWSSLRNEQERKKMEDALMTLTPGMNEIK
ncbi:uncharacterized protein LOC107271132 [Cephus cinctus]|uniref:Ribonuclease P/MRP protein subunit POP5 n=1 Tax=Cephus cinctus TaxID=211228 RepID=A0AAJ7FPR5_CEPCN|nr:uncharacterized protein LOC107271132 [Cephus cinctus]XP_015602248.1 uncharacterized protein LOC107271132 [Cephus cinctus]XP_015602249.1 uncharacterized protein LOC107271132 [Cephus cinctus]XP_015602250.1 uncharacterized protein LOC107271132 [Cephus cinctus]